MDNFVTKVPRFPRNKRGIDNSENNCNKYPRHYQSYIDLGQKSFGKLGTCIYCNQTYVIGDATDEKDHKRICSQSKKKIFAFAMKPNYIEEKRYEDETFIVSIPSKLLNIKDESSIHMFLNMVQEDLGTDPRDILHTEVTKFYLYVSRNQIIGCVVAEAISSEAFVELSNSKLPTEAYLQDSDSVTEIKFSNDIFSFTSIGIRHLWVHPSMRRKGIAKKLCDVCRKNFFFGRIICKNQIAFAQPTAEGMVFAFDYVDDSKFWGYS